MLPIQNWLISTCHDLCLIQRLAGAKFATKFEFPPKGETDRRGSKGYNVRLQGMSGNATSSLVDGWMDGWMDGWEGFCNKVKLLLTAVHVEDSQGGVSNSDNQPFLECSRLCLLSDVWESKRPQVTRRVLVEQCLSSQVPQPT